MSVVLIGNKKKFTFNKVEKYLKKRFKNVIVVNTSVNRRKKITKKLLALDIDLLISYYNYYIVPKKVLDKTKLKNINFHPGSSHYPGFGCYNFALINKSKAYGCVVHNMNSKIDSGSIFDEIKFNIKGIRKVNDLQLKTEKYMLKLFFKFFNYYFKKKYFLNKKIDWKRKPYTKKDFNKIFQLSLSKYKNLLRLFDATYHKNFENIFSLDKYKIQLDCEK